MTNELTAEQNQQWMANFVSDVRLFLLADDERMDAWIAFRKDREQARSEGIDTTKPRNMIKVSDYVYYCPPDEDDERTRSH